MADRPAWRPVDWRHGPRVEVEAALDGMRAPPAMRELAERAFAAEDALAAVFALWVAEPA